MKLRQVLIALFINLAFLLPCNGYGQSVDSYPIDSLTTKDTSLTIAMYKRVIYFSDNDSVLYLMHNKVALLLLAKNNFVDAAWHLKQAADINPTPNSLLKSAWCLLWSHQPKEAITLLDTGLYFDDFNAVEQYEATMLIGLSYEKMGYTIEAVGYYTKLYPFIGKTDSLILFQQNKKLLKLKYKNGNLAACMSALLPGLGQLYTGYHKEFLNSFILNGSLISGTILMAKGYTWIDGTLTFAPWLFRYYFGGIRRAKELAVEANLRQKEALYRERIDFFHHIKYKN
jgi:hypothetical protein